MAFPAQTPQTAIQHCLVLLCPGVFLPSVLWLQTCATEPDWRMMHPMLLSHSGPHDDGLALYHFSKAEAHSPVPLEAADLVALSPWLSGAV